MLPSPKLDHTPSVFLVPSRLGHSKETFRCAYRAGHGLLLLSSPGLYFEGTLGYTWLCSGDHMVPGIQLRASACKVCTPAHWSSPQPQTSSFLLQLSNHSPECIRHSVLQRLPCRGMGQWNPSPHTCLLDPCLMNLSWSESSHWVTWGCPSLSWLQWKTFTRGKEGLPPAEAGSEPSGSPKAP